MLQGTQKEFLSDMAEAGHYVATCYSAEQAVKVLKEYIGLSRLEFAPEGFTSRMSKPNNSVWKEGTISPLKKK